MPVNAKIVGKDGDVTDIERRTGGVGPVVYATDLVLTEPTTKFFLNPGFGANMNLNAGFTGTPELIHNGGNTTEYTASAVQGTKFSFTDTTFAVQSNITIVDWSLIDNGDGVTINGTAFLEDDTPTGNQFLAVTSDSVTATNLATAINAVSGFTASATSDVITVSEDTGIGITSFTENADDVELTIVTPASVETDNAAVNDIMQFAKGSDLTLSNFVAVTMRIYVDKDWAAGDNFIFCGYDTGVGVIVGDTVNLGDFFNFSDFDTWHSLVIPLTDLGIEAATTVDAFRIELTSKEGAKSPLVYFDRIQLEAAGGSETFQFTLEKNERFHIEELVFSYADVLAGTVSNGTMTGIAYDKILALSALPNGFTILRSKAGKTLFAVNIQSLGDHISAGAILENQMSDGTNTFVTLKTKFIRPLILTGQVGDNITITINDDMSGLLHFRAAARGGLEIIE